MQSYAWSAQVTQSSFYVLQVASIFLCVAAGYNHLVLPQNIHWFQALYYLSSKHSMMGAANLDLALDLAWAQR